MHLFIYDVLNTLTQQHIFHLLKWTIKSSRAEALFSVLFYYLVSTSTTREIDSFWVFLPFCAYGMFWNIQFWVTSWRMKRIKIIPHYPTKFRRQSWLQHNNDFWATERLYCHAIGLDPFNLSCCFRTVYWTKGPHFSHMNEVNFLHVNINMKSFLVLTSLFCPASSLLIPGNSTYSTLQHARPTSMVCVRESDFFFCRTITSLYWFKRGKTQHIFNSHTQGERYHRLTLQKHKSKQNFCT